MLRGFIYFFSLALFSSCYVAHPCRIEPVAPKPCERFTPACAPVIDALPVCPFDKENLTADELVDIALRNNPETRVSWNAAKAAAYQLQATKSTLYPVVAAEAGYAINYQNFHGGKGEVDNGIVVITDPTLNDDGMIDPSSGISFGEFIGGGEGLSQLVVSDVSASYLLFDFGKRCATINTAREALQIANFAHNRVMQNVMIDVLVSYYAFLGAKALLEARNDDLKDAEMNVKAADELFQAGCRCKLDLLQSQSQLLGIQVDIEETKGLVQIQLGNLANALGLPANTPVKVADLPKDLQLKDTTETVECLMEVAKKKRPDLAVSHFEYKKKQAEYCFALSDGMPIVSLNGDVERVDGITDNVASGFLYSGAVSVEMPLFQGYYYANRRRVALSKANAAYANLQAKESDVLLEVWKSYYYFKTAVKTFQFSEEFLKFTEMTYEAAMGSYKEGTGSILDLLAAQKALSRARAQKIKARTEWVISLAGIAYATGTL